MIIIIKTFVNRILTYSYTINNIKICITLNKTALLGCYKNIIINIVNTCWSYILRIESKNQRGCFFFLL